MSRLNTAVAAMLVLFAAHLTHPAAGQACDQTFMDAISSSGDTWLMQQGLKLTGYADKLPDPSIGVTILVPSNGAWWRFMWNNGLFLRQLSSLGDKLTAVVTFHVLPTAVTPEQLQGPEGRVPTLFGLLTGQDASLKHWLADDGVQYLFQGPWDGKIAGVDEVIQVCNSWVYIVNEVLKPAYDLSDVPKVEIPDLAFGTPTSPEPQASPTLSPEPQTSPSPEPGYSPAPASPAPVVDPALPAASPPPPACNKTFAQVAGETSGLSLLKTVLSQGAYASALPDPSGNYTLFAPTDAAFFDLLAAFNLSITDALALGDKLTAVLLYHVVPGALTPVQLDQQTVLTTGLALKTDNGGYQITVNGLGETTTVTGNYPGNTATPTANLAVCSSQVYVIDKVLIPAATLDAVPAVSGGLPPPSAPGPASAPATTLTTTAAAPATSAPAAALPAADSPLPAAPAGPDMLTPLPDAAAAPSPAPAVPAAAPAAAAAPSAAPVVDPAAAAAPSPAPVPAPPAQPWTAVEGVALGAGYMANCTVLLTVGGISQPSTTDGSGRFRFDCGGDCSALAAVVTLPVSSQLAECADSLTGLPPAFDIQASVSAPPEGVTLLSLSPLTTIIAAASNQQQAPPAAPEAAAPAAAPTAAAASVVAPAPAVASRKLLQDLLTVAAEQEAALLQQQQEQQAQAQAGGSEPAEQLLSGGWGDASFGIASEDGSSSSGSSSTAVGTSYGDPLQAALGGDMAAFNLLSANQELLCTGSVSGSLLASLVGGSSITPSSAAGAVFDQLAQDLLEGTPFNLTDIATVQRLVEGALADLAASATAAAPSGVDFGAVVEAAAQTITLLNSFLEQTVTSAQASQLGEAEKMVQVLARVTKVCQANVAPSALQLGSGQLSVDSWNQQYSQQAITDLAIQAMR